jgi:hypothetical protein
MRREHAAGIVVDLNLPAALHAGTLETKVEAANAGEE